MKKNKLKRFAQLLLISIVIITINSCEKDVLIVKKDPVVSWQNPSDIRFGTALSTDQLNASSDIAGIYAYTPKIGTVLTSGNNQELFVKFTPTNTKEYNSIIKTTNINVIPITEPVITWNNPEDIIYGAELSETQLNASTTIEGTFTYLPKIGTVLDAGSEQDLLVNFVPNDLENYNSVSKTVKINVGKADPVITWANPYFIYYNTPLGAEQLNATANVDGEFVYTPEAGTLLDAGTDQILELTFTPTNSNRYNTISKSVLIDVHEFVPAIWTSGTTGTIDGIEFTITAVNGIVKTYDFSTSDYSAGPLSNNQNCLNYSGYYNWTITFSSPITNLKLYCNSWRTDTYTFDQSFTILSGEKLTANNNTLSAVSYSDGIIEFPGTISSLSVVSTQICCSHQAMTIAL